ncbi:MAG: hypothetical protein ACTSRG_19600 [Candidatus Helarchaeota archaeon]
MALGLSNIAGIWPFGTAIYLAALAGSFLETVVWGRFFDLEGEAWQVILRLITGSLLKLVLSPWLGFLLEILFFNPEWVAHGINVLLATTFPTLPVWFLNNPTNGEFEAAMNTVTDNYDSVGFILIGPTSLWTGAYITGARGWIDMFAWAANNPERCKKLNFVYLAAEFSDVLALHLIAHGAGIVISFGKLPPAELGGSIFYLLLGSFCEIVSILLIRNIPVNLAMWSGTIMGIAATNALGAYKGNKAREIAEHWGAGGWAWLAFVSVLAWENLRFTLSVIINRHFWYNPTWFLAGVSPYLYRLFW